MASPGKKYTTISGLLLLLVLLMIWWDSNGASPPDEPNPECPHDYSGHPLALPGNTTSIPEFHDCQRLIKPDGKTYGTLAGVFARQGLADLHINSVSLVVPVVDTAGHITGTVTATGDTAVIGGAALLNLETALRSNSVALAEIQSYDGPYRPLGIERGLNCLYLVRIQPPGGLPYMYRGLMINVADDNACLNAPPQTGGKWLVVRHSGPDGGPAYPAVSRWDWDDNITPVTPNGQVPGPRHNKQYVSMFCDRDWCEVGDADLIPVPQRNVNLGSTAADAVWEQKGRYDEQRLAVTGTGGLEPSLVKASASPAPGLDALTIDNFKTDWQQVANTVLPTAIEIYRTKFNYGAGSIPGVTNQVSLCAGWRFHCMPFFTALATMFTLRCWMSDGDGDPATTNDRSIWWARIVGSDGTTKYRCVWRRVHPGVTPPTAVRWRWKKADEGLWTRCDAGCCEVEEKS